MKTQKTQIKFKKLDEIEVIDFRTFLKNKEKGIKKKLISEKLDNKMFIDSLKKKRNLVESNYNKIDKLFNESESNIFLYGRKVLAFMFKSLTAYIELLEEGKPREIIEPIFINFLEEYLKKFIAQEDLEKFISIS